MSNEQEKNNSQEFEIKLTESDKELLRKLDMEHRAKMNKQVENQDVNAVEEINERGELKPVPISIPNPKSKQNVS